MSKAVVLAVDGHNMLHRGYHATAFSAKQRGEPLMCDSKGNPTNAIRGLVNILLADIKRVGATHVGVVFDRHGTNFRYKLYPEYKGQRSRDEHSDLIDCQILPCKKVLNAMGINVFGSKTKEGDDITGSIAVRCAKSKKVERVYIDSRDKDFGSLVTDKIHLLQPDGVMLDADGVFEKWGVRPDQMVEYLMLLGDGVDNIPGVNKCGPGTAAKWLNEYGSIKGIMKKHKFTPKMGEHFEAAKPFFEVSRKLITLKTDFLPDLKLSHLRLRGEQPELAPLCEKLGFKQTYKQVRTMLRGIQP